MHLTPLLLILAFAATISGAILLWLGLRGRRVGNHLHCGNCEFDLFGLPADASRCPECGKLIRYGRRRGRWELRKATVWTGVMLLGISVPTMVTIIFGENGGIRWIEYKPVWLITREITHPRSGASPGDHLTELQRRIRASELDAEQFARLVGNLLDYQADGDRPWSASVGELIESLRRIGKMNSADWQRYLSQGTVVGMRVRKISRLGDPIAIALSASPKRSGRSPFAASFRIDRVMQGSSPVRFAADQWPVSRQRDGATRQDVILEEPFPVGVHHVTVDYTLTIGDAAPLGGGIAGATSQPSSSATINGSIPIEFEVRAADPTIGPIPVGTFGRMMLRSNRISGLTLSALRRTDGGDTSVVLTSRSDNIPALAMDVFLYDGTREWNMGSFCTTTEMIRPEEFAWTVKDFPAATRVVNVILRPSRSAALRRAEVDHFRDIELIFEQREILP